MAADRQREIEDLRLVFTELVPFTDLLLGHYTNLVVNLFQLFSVDGIPSLFQGRGTKLGNQLDLAASHHHVIQLFQIGRHLDSPQSTGQVLVQHLIKLLRSILEAA